MTWSVATPCAASAGRGLSPVEGAGSGAPLCRPGLRDLVGAGHERGGCFLRARRYGEQLHEAIEAKEGVAIQEASMNRAFITYSRFMQASLPRERRRRLGRSRGSRPARKNS